MGPITRQELQSLLDTSKNRILEKVVNRSDMQPIQDLMKTILTIFQQNQLLLKHLEDELMQVSKRDILLESRLGTVERDIKDLKAEMLRMLDLEPIIIEAYQVGRRKEVTYTQATT